METERKFINPTTGFVGAVKLNHEGKAGGVAVEPGGFVWLTATEERLTAEAPQLPQDNPFVAEWQKPPADWDGFSTEGFTTETGALQLAQEPARPLASDRYIPTEAEAPPQEPAPTPPAPPGPSPEEEAADAPVEVEEITGAPPIAPQPPVEGQPSPGEVVGTPEAPAQNDEHVARERARAAEEVAQREKPQPVGEGGPRGQDAINVQRKPAPALV